MVSTRGLMGRVPAFGRSSQDSYASYDPATSSLKTHHNFAKKDLTGSFVILPRAGTMRSGTVYEHTMLERHTCGSACLLLPTPVVSDSKDRGANLDYSMRRRGRNGGDTLARAIGGPSNPNHREWLMGFPASWTKISDAELKLLVTRSFRKSLNG